MQAENLSNVVPPPSRSSNYIALGFCNFPPDITYGSAVLFNIEDHEVESYLKIVQNLASGLLTEMRKDDYCVKEQLHWTKDMQGEPDYIVVKTLDTDSIRIIGSVLGQSIGLDYFVSQIKLLGEKQNMLKYMKYLREEYEVTQCFRESGFQEKICDRKS